MRTVLLLLPVSLTLALLACSGDETTPSDESPSGSSSSSSSGGSNGLEDAAGQPPPADSGTDANTSTDAALPSENIGSIVLEHAAYTEPQERASAVFGARDDHAARLARIEALPGAVRDGNCVYVPTLEGTKDPTWRSQSAGDLTFRHEGSQRTLPYGGFGPYYSERYTDEPMLDAAGGEVEVEAAGGTIASFTGRFTVPAATTLSAPSMDDAQRIEIGPGDAISLAWAPTVAGARFAFGMNVEVEPAVTRALACDFDGATGSGQVPAALLQNFADQEVAYAYAYTALSSTVETGTHLVTLEGQQTVRIGDGSVFNGAVLFGDR